MMETFSRLTGVRYPWNKYAQTTVADFIGGMENVTATTLVDWLPDSTAYLDRPWYQWALIPHELAHQWFGDLVTTENWANYWLNEGMAEFMPSQYWGAKLGERAEEDYYLSEYQQYLAADARRRMPLAAWNSNVVYPKGALVLSMLKKQLGAERFWASIKRFLTDHAYGNATSDDLRQAVLDATGESLGWFWSQWIYRAGFPAFAVTATYDSAGRALSLMVRQTQTDTATADSTGLRFETPAVFRAPIAIRVGTASGDTVVRAVIASREQTIRVEQLRAPPMMVVFDADNAVVKSLDFPQPTSWLAAQLERESNLWNRIWAIDQLRARRPDTSAAAALARAARRADYPLIRAQAAAALAGFASPVTLATLEDATRDTSAAVRKAAATALGTIGGDRAAGVLREVWTKDPSYETRAAALTGLARLDPTGARDQVLRGIETSSYRDVIQNAAIAAALQRPDDEIIAAIARRIGDQPVPAVALAVLSARGDSAALGAFTGGLDDDRAWVRSWALDAAEGQLDRDDAIAVLEAALPAVRKTTARAAIEAVVERLRKSKG
jgi:aminopeptidase N